MYVVESLHQAFRTAKMRIRRIASRIPILQKVSSNAL